MDESRLHVLIGEIYERCLDPKRAPDAGRTIEKALGVGSSIHFLSEQSSGRMVQLLSASANFDAKARCDYGAHYHDRNVWFQRALPRRPPVVVRGEELIEEQDFLRTEFCADWCSRVDIFHMIGCTYPALGPAVSMRSVPRAIDSTP